MKKNCKGLPGCNKKQDKLSLLKRAQNLIATTTKHVANGLKNISDTDYIQRVVECTKCEKLVDNNMCSMCGCYIPTKARWEVSECPMNKWKK
tara:strand:+ start:360 stop:635 length:276 start_codon:yes stop_codon:yes gene_type:complete